MEHIIRPIEISELSLLEDFLYEAIFIPQGVKPPPRRVIYEPTVYHYIDCFGSKKGDVCFVCMGESGVVGAAWSQILDVNGNRGYGNIGDGIPELSVSVMPDFRNKGIGSELLKQLHAALAKLGYRQISLSVQKDNAARRLYERCGYITFREKETDLIMVREL